MSLATKTLIGALWSVGTRLGARVVGLVGTLVITRFLAPDIMGEVAVAVVTVKTARELTEVAFGQYVVVKTKDDPGAVYHALFYSVVTVLVTGAILILLADVAGRAFGAPDMGQYVPGMVLSICIGRVARIPESIALRDLRFKLFSLCTAGAELTFVIVSVGLAASGAGGHSIVWGNVAQDSFRLIVLLVAVDRSAWLTRVPITKKQTLDLLRFGVPLALGGIASFASKTWDRLIISRLFGTATLGVFGLSRRLGAVPADNVGDAVSDVMMPSLVRMEPERARLAVVRASRLVAVVVYPLAVGLAVVAPTLVQTLFTPQWWGIAPLLTILAAMSAIDPLGDAITVYLKARDLPRLTMVTEVGYLVTLLGATSVLGLLYGIEGACVGVGCGVAFRAIFGLTLAHVYDRVPMVAMLGGLAGPALAAGLMAVAVLGFRDVIGHQITPVWLRLASEIGVGAGAYVLAAFTVSRSTALEVIGLLKRSRRGGDEEDDAGPA